MQNSTKTTQPKRISSMTELRDNLADVYEKVKTGDLETEAAKSLSSIAGKMIFSVRTQMEYQVARGEKPNIGFMK